MNRLFITSIVGFWGSIIIANMMDGALMWMWLGLGIAHLVSLVVSSHTR